MEVGTGGGFEDDGARLQDLDDEEVDADLLRKKTRMITRIYLRTKKKNNNKKTKTKK